MYIRPSVVRKAGKTYRYYQLVRSVRRNGRIVQETVAHLGKLDARGRAKARALADHICGSRTARQHALFGAEHDEPQSARVRIDKLRVERSRRFGDVWLGLTLWQALELDRICSEILPAGRERVPWSQVAAIQVIGRLCEPASELHVAEHWYARTALEDLLGVPAELLNGDRLYRLLDHVIWHKTDLEQHLRKRLGDLFQLEYDLLLYDVTSTYFEGLCARNAMAKHGYSRDHRPDCRQVCIALVVTREGIPLGYEVFDGNSTDVTTVKTIIGAMEARYGKARRIWVMDRGMYSQRNVDWLIETGRLCLVGAPRTILHELSEELGRAEGWQTVRDGVEVKPCRARGNDQESFVICRSSERRTKEQAMHARFSTRIERESRRVAERVERRRSALDPSEVNRQIGRILERNAHAAKRYRIETETRADHQYRGCGETKRRQGFFGTFPNASPTQGSSMIPNPAHEERLSPQARTAQRR